MFSPENKNTKLVQKRAKRNPDFQTASFQLKKTDISRKLQKKLIWKRGDR